MGILGWLLFGLVIGLLARAIMPGRQSMGIIMTILLGVAGSFIGGLIATLITDRSFDVFHTAGFIGSLLGAILLLAIGGWLSSRRGGRTARAT